MHPAPGNWTGTLVNALLHHMKTQPESLSSIGGKERPGLVHRLDKNTTGILVVAKTDQAHRSLANQFKRHTITRVYEALIMGKPKAGEGKIELSIGRDTKDRKKFSSRTTRPRNPSPAIESLNDLEKRPHRSNYFPGLDVRINCESIYPPSGVPS